MSAGSQCTGSAITNVEKKKHKTICEILAEQANRTMTITTSYKNGESNWENFSQLPYDKVDSEKMKSDFLGGKGKNCHT